MKQTNDKRGSSGGDEFGRNPQFLKFLLRGLLRQLSRCSVE
ncbi:MAG: hypothetical protein OEV17_01875 [Nitrospira sp.]|nr:hypothetical protein [Nitrospira sp.]